MEAHSSISFYFFVALVYFCIAATTSEIDPFDYDLNDNGLKVSPEALPCVQPHSESCNLVALEEHYPENKIRELLKKGSYKTGRENYYDFLKRLLKLENPSTKDWEKSCNRCQSRRFTGLPKIGMMAHTREIYYIVNINDLEGPGVQPVQYDVCNQAGCQCSRCQPDDISEGTTCQQLYRKRILLYYNHKEDKLAEGKFLIPSGCMCKEERKTVDSYFSIEKCCAR